MKRMILFTALVFGTVLPISAQERSVGLGLGIVEPQDLDGALWLTANARIRVAGRLLIEPEVGYWSSSARSGYADEIAASMSVRDLSFSLHVLYELFQAPRVSFGGGLGAHSFSGDVEVWGYWGDLDYTRLGVHFLAGTDLPVGGRAALFLNLRYDLVKDWNQFKGYAGLRVSL